MNQEQEQFVPQGNENAPAQENTSFSPAATTPSQDDYTRGWSWGGFMFNAYFALATRKYSYLWLLLLNLIPYLGTFIMMVIFGVKGREMTMNSRTFDNEQQRLGFVKAMDHAGKIVFYIFLAIFALAFFAFMALGAMVSGEGLGDARERAEEAARMQDMQARNIDHELEDMRRDLERMDY